MENGTSGKASIIVLAFGKKPRAQDEWVNLAKRIINTANIHSVAPVRILDGITSGIGRVCEIRTTGPGQDGSNEVSLDYCSALRRSQAIHEIESTADVEVVVQPINLYEAHKTAGLAVFDMDSTLIQQEVIDELARSVDRYDQVAAVTEAAMRGELNFEESLKARVAKLQGVSTGVWDYMKANVITFTPGARELLKALKALGWKTAVLSGGFTPLAYWVKDELGLDHAYANQLAVDETGEKLTGELLSNALIVGPSLKKETLLRLAAESNIPIQHTIAVGDGSNDLPMIHAAGLGVAFNAKPKVQEAAPARLNGDSLTDILHVLGYTADDVASLIR